MGVRGELVCVLLLGVFWGTFGTPRNFNHRNILLEDVLLSARTDEDVDCSADAATCASFQECVEKEDGRKLCECPKGKSGNECATIDWCLIHGAGCEAAGGKCEYDGAKGIGICNCAEPEKKYDTVKAACKVPCSVTEVCQNKGECPEGEEGVDLFCECLAGTAGDKCEVIEWCTAENTERCSQAGGECLYDDVKHTGFCDCTGKEGFVFDDKESQCKPICTGDDQCSNGAKCVGDVGKEICQCLEGTSGETCQIVEYCKTHGDNCKNQEGECEFNIEKGKGYCDCKKEKDVKFDEKKGTCKKTCADETECGHGAACEGPDDKFCVCKEGTSGDKCGTIDWCTANGETCKEEGGECKYDSGKGSGFCECSGTNKKFDPKLNKCRETCNAEASDCKNDAACVGDDDKFCNCKNLTSGDKCEKNEWCVTYEKICKDGGAKCEYDPVGESGFCECLDKDQKFITRVEKCKVTCSVNEDCSHGGVCHPTEKICDCPKGTSGDKCTDIDWCTLENKALCTKGGATCQYDAAKESGACKCADEKLKFDTKENSCRETCSKDSDCKNGGPCQGTEEKFCRCLKGTSGYKCATVDWCTLENKAICTKGGATCQYDAAKESGVCKCADANLKFDTKLGSCRAECEKDADCAHGAKCEEKHCSCKKGTSGDKCDTVDWCLQNDEDCKIAGGECSYDPEKGSGFCKCKDDNSDYIEKDKKCRNPCEINNPCQNNGTCEVKNRKVTCNCKRPYTGDKCEKSPCNDPKDPCQNGGKCSVTEDGFHCKCHTDYAGEKCEKECQPGCGENKFCKIENEEPTCVCLEGYDLKEDKCVEINKCEEDPDICGSYGDCENLGKGKHKCNCNDTYTGDDCNEQYCESSPCQNNGECGNEAKTYKCTCINGYVGKNCEDHSFCQDKPCGKASCEVSEDALTGYCQCEDVTQYFDYKEKKCQDVDQCLAVSCDEDKICKSGTCVCKDGYTKAEDGKCTASFCKSNTCGAGFNCTEMEKMAGLVQCRCSASTHFFNGKSCADARCFLKEKPINAGCGCPSTMKWNKDTGDCVNEDEKTRCADDCGLGWCLKVKGDNKCACGNRFKNVKDDTGKCILNADKICAGGLGLVEDGSKCNCSGKYEMAANGITCERKTMCADEVVKDKCSKAKGRCVDKWSTEEGYECQCDKGYVKIDGVCSDPCHREKDKMRCMENDQICAVDETYNPVCRCPMTFEERTQGKCDAVAKYSYILENIHIKKEKYMTQGYVNRFKLNEDVVKAMKQLYTDLDHAYLADSPVEGGALNCKVELKFRSKPNSVAARLQQQVKRGLNCTNCDKDALVLPPSLLISGDVKDVTLTNISLCSPIIQNKLCGPGSGCKDLKCFCLDGYRKSDIGFKPVGEALIQRCDAIDHCAEGAHCPENSECQNKVPDFFCKCTKGFRKEGTTVSQDQPENVAKCVGICDLKPCKHGKCNTTGDNYDCSCEPGFAGKLCDKPDGNYLKAAKNTTVVGAVLGTILGIVLIIFFITVRRLRKNNYSEDFSSPSSHQMEMNDGEMMERRHVRGISNKGYQ